MSLAQQTYNDSTGYIMGRIDYFIYKEDYKKAIVYINKLIRLDPKEPDYHFRKAEFLLHLGNLNEAKKEYTRLIELDSSLWQARGQRGNIYLEGKRYDSALLDFNQMMGKNRVLDSATYVYRAKSYEGLQNYEAAEKDYTAIINLSSNDARLYIDRANIRYLRRNFEGALQDLNAIITLDKTIVEAYRGRAYILAELGKVDDAIKNIQVFLKASPNDDAGNCLAGELLSRKRDYENAIPHLTVCVQKKGSKNVYMLRGMAYYNTASYAAAEDDFLKMLTFKLTTAEEAEALYHIGVCKNNREPRSGCDFIRRAFQKSANEKMRLEYLGCK